MLRYWFSVLHQAITGSFDTIGQSWFTLLYAILVLGLGAGLVWFRLGTSAFREHITQTVFELVAVAALAWLPFFVWHILLTPYRMQQAVEARAHAAEESSKLIEEDNKDKAKQIERLKEQLAARPEKDRSETNHAQRKAIRESLADFMQRGIQLRNRCKTDAIGSTLEGEAQKWFEEVQGFLTRNLDKSYLEQFRATRLAAFSPDGVPNERLKLWHGLDQRTVTLDKFIDELK